MIKKMNMKRLGNSIKGLVRVAVEVHIAISCSIRKEKLQLQHWTNLSNKLVLNQLVGLLTYKKKRENIQSPMLVNTFLSITTTMRQEKRYHLGKKSQ